ncbi:hypothetical protein SMICM304S_00352 [Streptomyces microflavus]
MMPWPWPIVLDEELVACAECGTYRDWLVLSTRDQVWLRCRAGHQQHEPRLDTAWYNRDVQGGRAGGAAGAAWGGWTGECQASLTATSGGRCPSCVSASRPSAR